ncbi:MAG: hypothetical protein PVF58_19060 [Candidatus Methanofastidiosia archaeon]|jgi:hypothetical protein
MQEKMNNKEFIETILNLSKYHREHEKYYSWAPLDQAIKLQHSSQILKTFADKWKDTIIKEKDTHNRYTGCEDLNEPSTIQHNGVLFMEGEDEPPEISRLKRDIKILADDFNETSKWLSEAMESSWEIAGTLVKIPELAEVLGERHRIIINDWEAAKLSLLISHLIMRALDILEEIDFSPEAIRTTLKGKGNRTISEYLYSSSELIDRAADLASTSAMLVHDNERRWRVFRAKILEMQQQTARE